MERTAMQVASVLVFMIACAYAFRNGYALLAVGAMAIAAFILVKAHSNKE